MAQRFIVDTDLVVFCRIDSANPTRSDSSGEPQTLENFTRVEVFGSPNPHWIRVSVDANDPTVFLMEQGIVSENRFPR